MTGKPGIGNLEFGRRGFEFAIPDSGSLFQIPLLLPPMDARHIQPRNSIFGKTLFQKVR